MLRTREGIEWERRVLGQQGTASRRTSTRRRELKVKEARGGGHPPTLNVPSGARAASNGSWRCSPSPGRPGAALPLPAPSGRPLAGGVHAPGEIDDVAGREPGEVLGGRRARQTDFRERCASSAHSTVSRRMQGVNHRGSARGSMATRCFTPPEGMWG